MLSLRASCLTATLFLGAASGMVGVAAGGTVEAFAQEVSFARDVLPLVSDRCFACHGPDDSARKSDLRFDERASVYGDRDGYAVVVPGDLEESELIARITSEFPDELMPPEDSNLTLSAEEIDILRRWVEQGATWEEHWAFVAPVRPALPSVQQSDWPHNAIDHFVLARLEAAGAAPNAQASPSDLLRRVTLDLTGLPPTLDELDAFLADPSDAAYAAVVERLLASSRYGERMAWEWLDAARYADTDGFQGDPTRAMWPWRDWLVQSLNDNVPFDQLTIEMIAGDLLPNATAEQVLASGFHRNHMYNGEGGRIEEETRVENVMDRVETTATTWLGLTVGCARCHDHRFDPVSQAEYYQLYDFFNQTSESGKGGNGKAPPTLRYLNPAQRERVAALESEIEAADALRRQPSDALDAAQQSWEHEKLALFACDPGWAQPSKLGAWSMTAPLPPPSGDGATLFGYMFTPEQRVNLAETHADGSPLWSPATDLVDGETLALPEDVGATYFFREITAPTPRQMSLSFGSDDAIRVWVNDAEVVSRNVRRGVRADQELITIELVAGRNELLVKIVNTGGIGGVYFRRVAETVAGLTPDIAGVLLIPAGERTDDETAQIMAAFRATHSDDWTSADERISERTEERKALLAAAPVVMVMDELPADQRRTSHILERGGYDKLLAPVAAATPAFLPKIANDAAPDRMDLAHWLIDSDNPLTARVTINRIWQTLFGRGLVATTEDFGRQGDTPTHPELLDWLAVEFESGWDMKAMNRLIVLSATYRQSASASPDAYRSDPHNEHLARGARYRMPSWMIRDQALALSDLLVETVGGPPVMPFQPDGIWAEATFGAIRYTTDSAPKRNRRSLYVFWRRIVQPTFFFDTAKRQICEVRRNLTNTPLHALIALNEPMYVEAARYFALRAWRNGGDDAEARITWSFRSATARVPSAAELAILLGRWSAARATFSEDTEAGAALLGDLDAGTLPTADLAALTIVCSVILNLDEVLSKP